MSKFILVHDCLGRLRFRPKGKPLSSIAMHEWIKKNVPLHEHAKVIISEKTGSVLVTYTDMKVRDSFLLSFITISCLAHSHEPIDKRYGLLPNSIVSNDTIQEIASSQESVPNPIPKKIFSYFLPKIVQYGSTILQAIPYIFSALGNIVKGNLNMKALDGAALLVCLLRRDFTSLSSIIFFFALGEYLEDWTKKKSRTSLAESLSLNISHVWVKSGELEHRIPFAEVKVDDLVIVRTGFVFPVDGTIVEGEGLVNQASMTGESLPVHKTIGTTVFAGTVLEEGSVVVKASKVGSNTRITSLLKTIEESETAKATIQGKYEHMADAIVPYNFLLAGLVFALTRNVLRASSVFLVDYSCAIRLATPLCIFTAMRQSAERGILIKGGKFMEQLSDATAIVFDKTGTLTEAKPILVEVRPFAEYSQTFVLKLAACLEEHFIHPFGQAVVNAADAEGLKHREEHTKVEYIVAHGISSIWKKQRVRIGSYHFIHEDCQVPFTAEQQKIIDEQSSLGRSVLYLAVGENLAGILLIEDKIRKETPKAINDLRNSGFERIIMLTGDGQLTAAHVAKKAGIDEFHAHLLPQDKADFLVGLKKEGHKVIMVGDGINDSPALSVADVGISMAEGADIAREVADVVLVSGELNDILFARELSKKTLKRINTQVKVSIAVNSLFLLGGLLGMITPAISALLHNASTATIALGSIRPLKMLPQNKKVIPSNAQE